MRMLWDTYLPVALIALALGAAFGWKAFPYATPRWGRVMLGVIVVTAIVGIWHGPLGAATRFRAASEGIASRTLVYYEMKAVTARLEDGPLTRRMLLSGTADGFQRSELVRIMGQVPGVASARWTDAPGGRPWRLPLLGEALVFVLIAFATGVIFAYLIELRRRASRYDRF